MKSFKSRHDKLKDKINIHLSNSTSDNNLKTLQILSAVGDYEKDNLATIKTLKREKTITLNKINGALKSSIDAHGPITKLLIGSASKRIYGATLVPPVENKVSKNERNNNLLRIVLEISAILYIIYTVWK